MKGVPTETLVDVLDRLSFKDQLTFQYVSKAWRKYVLSCFDGVATLKGVSIICKLSQVLQDAERNGSDCNGFGALIKKLIISGEGAIRDTCRQFISLLRRTPNLNEIEFSYADSTRFLQSMDEANVSLDNLRFIKLMGKENMTNVAAIYLSVNLKYAASVERIRFRVWHHSTSLLNGPFRHQIGSYLGRFPHLKNFSIMISETLDLLPILESGPNLTSHTIKGSHPILVKNPVSKVYSNLVTLKAEIYSFEDNKGFSRYIAHNLTSLQTLKIYSGTLSNTSVIMNGFKEFIESKGGKSPYVTVLSFSHLYGLWPDCVDMISTWLCHLKELHFKNCAFEGVWDNKFNVYLEIGAMDLDLISIDVTRILQKSGNIKKLCFEVTLRNGGERTTVYYLRVGEKWSPNTLFERKSQASLANKSNSRAAAKKKSQ